MPTYNAAAVSDAAIAFQKPVTLQQGRGLRDNPEAVYEGGTGAPRVQGRALGGVYMGQLVLASFTGGAFSGLDRYGAIRADFAVIGTGPNIEIQYSNDNGATYGAYQIIIGAVDAIGAININLQTGVYSAYAFDATSGPTTTNGTHTVPANCNAFQTRTSTTGVTQYVSTWHCFGGLE